MARISLRIGQELYDKIEAQRGDTDRSSYIKDVLVRHFDGQSQPNDTRQDDEIKYLRSKLDEALKLVTQAQILQLQTQRALPEPATETPVIKKWYQFWKK